jgi:hypothetical protein
MFAIGTGPCSLPAAGFAGVVSFARVCRRLHFVYDLRVAIMALRSRTKEQP